MPAHQQPWQPAAPGQAPYPSAQPNGQPNLGGYHHSQAPYPQSGYPSAVSPSRPGAQSHWQSHTPPDFGSARNPPAHAYAAYDTAPYQPNQAVARAAQPSYTNGQPSYQASGSGQRSSDPYSQGSEYNVHHTAPWAGNGAAPSVLQSQLPTVQTNFNNRNAPSNGNTAPRSFGSGLKQDDVDDFDDDDDDRLRARGRDDALTGSAGAAQKGTSDFVKKLFSMLDDKAYENVVAWSPSGESFVVKDMNDFTKHVLPRNFRHSNFASFVRQLNKYDFHKVKNPDDPGTGAGEHTWEFQHPDFIRGREDLLENVRRKIPAKKKLGKNADGAEPRDDSPALPQAGEAAERAAESYSELKAQVASLTAMQDQLSGHINGLTKQYQGVIGEMLTFQKNMVQQDQLMQNLIQYLMNVEADKRGDANLLHGLDGPFVPSEEAGKLISNYEDVTQASFATMSEISQRMSNAQAGSAGPSSRASAKAPGSLPDRRHPSSVAPIEASGSLSPKSVSSPLDAAAKSSTSSHGPKGKDKAKRSDEGNGVGRGPHRQNGTSSATMHPPHEHIESDGSTANLVNAAASSLSNPSLAQFERAGLRVFTVGTLQPREGNEDYLANRAADPTARSSTSSHSSLAEAVGSAFRRQSSSLNSSGSGDDFGLRVPHIEDLPQNMPKIDGRSNSISGTPPPASASTPGYPGRSATPSDGGANYLRVRRSTFVPGWAIPPRVLLVDDDAVCRKLSSKFLQVFGCSIDYAVDGMSAVNKMNLEKYDLVLMDIVMPNLDGVSATSLIRQFDPRTPIISMTSNSGPSELMQYISHGMNDILPKPFTKEGLLNMLEKHLIHLKTVQKMEDIPRSLGLSPVTESALQSALHASSSNAASHQASNASLHGASSYTSGGSHGGSGDDTVNPLAGMGFSDEEYIAMLQNLIAAGSFSDSAGNLTNPVSSLVGTTPGEGVGPRSKEGTPMATGGIKRSASDAHADEQDVKRSRFTEIH